VSIRVMTTKMLTRARIFPILLLALLAQAIPAVAQTKPDAISLASFAGTWKGICSHGNKEFVVLTLNPSGAELTGNISIANMHGEAGQCQFVIDPPSAEHAMKVSAAQLQGAALAFKAGEHAQFEMTITSPDSAKLKFLGTPVEKQPWELKRSK
jgi:hypothetical protein